VISSTLEDVDKLQQNSATSNSGIFSSTATVVICAEANGLITDAEVLTGAPKAS
jgi:hypothetical protein